MTALDDECPTPECKLAADAEERHALACQAAHEAYSRALDVARARRDRIIAGVTKALDSEFDEAIAQATATWWEATTSTREALTAIGRTGK